MFQVEVEAVELDFPDIYILAHYGKLELQRVLMLPYHL